MHTATPTHIAEPTHFAGDPVAVDAVTTTGWEAADGASRTFAHTCSGANRLLLVFIPTRGTAGSYTTACTYNGVAMTQLWQDDATFAAMECWYIVNPAAGANNVVVSHGNLPSAGANYVAVSLTGVHQTNPIDSATNPVTHGSGTNVTATLTPTAANCLLLGAMASIAGTATGAVGQDERWNSGATNDRVTAGATKSTGAFTWTTNLSRPYAVGVIAIAPTAAPIHVAVPTHF